MDEATREKLKAITSQLDALVINLRLPSDVQMIMLTAIRNHMFDVALDLERAVAQSRGAGGPVTKPVATLP